MDIDEAWATASGHRADNGWAGGVGDIDDLKGSAGVISYIGIVALDIDGFWVGAGSYRADNSWAGGVGDIDDLERVAIYICYVGIAALDVYGLWLRVGCSTTRSRSWHSETRATTTTSCKG